MMKQKLFGLMLVFQKIEFFGSVMMITGGAQLEQKVHADHVVSYIMILDRN